MEFVATNAEAQPPRREKLGGRSYLVAHITSIVPGILNGSRGPLLYTSEDTGADPSAWNGMPIVIGHPKDSDGNHISARAPKVLEQFGIGQVFESRFDGKLTHEGWFDEALTQAADKRLGTDIYHRLTHNLPMEMSTGLFTDDEKAAPGATYNGQPYEFIARNQRPDHIAILPDEKGACSNKDGCGVNVNATDNLNRNNPSPTKGKLMAKTMTKNQMVKYLTANCDCWKGQEQTLNSFPDETLKKFVSNARIVLVVNKAAKLGVKRLVRNAEGDGEGEAAGVDIAALAEFLGIAADPASDPVGFVQELGAKLGEVQKKLGIAGKAEAPAKEPAAMEEDEEDPTVMAEGEGDEEEVVAAAEDDPEKDQPAPTSNRCKQSTRAWLANAPEEVRQVVGNAMKAERKQLIAKITAPIANAKQRAVKAAALQKEPLPILRKLAVYAPAVNHAPRTSDADGWFDVDSPMIANDSADYAGVGGGGLIGNDGEDDLLPEITFDFAATRNARLAANRAN